MGIQASVVVKVEVILAEGQDFSQGVLIRVFLKKKMNF